MAIPDFFRTVSFTTNADDYELLTDANIKSALMTRLGITSEQYDALVADDGEGITRLNVTIFASDTRISVNDESYDNQEPIRNRVFPITGGDYVRTAIKSIRVEDTGITGTVYFGSL